jgi:hypothetical protein
MNNFFCEYNNITYVRVLLTIIKLLFINLNYFTLHYLWLLMVSFNYFSLLFVILIYFTLGNFFAIVSYF